MSALQQLLSRSPPSASGSSCDIQISEQTEQPLDPNDTQKTIKHDETNTNNDKRMEISPKLDHNSARDEEKDSFPGPQSVFEKQMNAVRPSKRDIMLETDKLDEKEQSMHNNHHDRHSNLKSTFLSHQRAWVDPWEAAVADTFYHKEIQDLRPTFEVVKSSIAGTQSLKTLFAPDDDENDDNDNDNNDDDKNADDIELEETEKEMAENPKKRNKFGPWDGVMAGCLLNIFGVIMFLRVGFVVGQAGIIQALIIMVISSCVTILTTLSMSAICTNGTILAGGAYYIISWALGPSIGGAIGILFSIGNMAACSLYLIGFAETLVTNLREMAGFQIFDDPIMDVRVWSNVVLCFVLLLAIIGLKYVIKAQIGLLIFIICAILLFFVGSFYKEVYNDNYPNPDYPDDCVDVNNCPETIIYLVITPKGWVNGNLIENLGSGYDGYNFWGVLSIFFPAVTGIMAGANISGDLRNPSSDIPKGTLTAIFISTIVYMVLAVFVGAVTVRYELIHNELVMALICVSEYIVLIGIYAATLSSAIASLVGAPRILQAVANDNLFPFRWLAYFGKGNKEGNPIRGYFLSFVVAFCCNLIGSLNAIAPLISQFFMLTYLLINLACFALTISKSPGWRPSFKYFNKWTSGFGALICLVIMFLLNWIYALIAGLLAFLIYAYIEWRDPEVNWGAAPQARQYYNVYKSVLRLRKTKSMHVKNWRPGILVLIRDPINRAQLMLFAQTLKKAYGAIFFATVHTGDYRTNIRKFREAHNLGYLPSGCPKSSKGFYESILAETFRSGVQTLVQTAGLGSVRANTLLIGFKHKWQMESDELITEYVQILRDTLVMGMALMIMHGFKRINWFLDEYAPPALRYYHDTMTNVSTTSVQETEDSEENSEEDETFLSARAWAKGQTKDTCIDVWWMLDDGGLCMLIPYILKLHKFWSRCQLRMLMVSEQDSLSTDVITMRSLIEKFRLPYKGPIVVTAKKKPHPKTVEMFEAMAKCKIEDTPRPSVTQKWLILSELLYEKSRYSGLNVVTLPIPSKAMKPRVYMALLNMLSDQDRLPPTIIMRGNGESTLTFYSE